jgi:hypothetical protein
LAPVLITVGDDFLGLAMVSRPTSSGYETADWTDLFPVADTTEEGAA